MTKPTSENVPFPQNLDTLNRKCPGGLWLSEQFSEFSTLNGHEPLDPFRFVFPLCAYTPPR